MLLSGGGTEGLVGYVEVPEDGGSGASAAMGNGQWDWDRGPGGGAPAVSAEGATGGARYGSFWGTKGVAQPAQPVLLDGYD